MLDIDVIVPHLNANNLLTKDNVKMLTNVSKSQHEKTEYLVYILPRKNYGWFEKFLQCLEQSAEVARHADLVKELTVTLDDMKQTNNSKQNLAGECSAANEVIMPCGSGREEVEHALCFTEPAIDTNILPQAFYFKSICVVVPQAFYFRAHKN